MLMKDFAGKPTLSQLMTSVLKTQLCSRGSTGQYLFHLALQHFDIVFLKCQAFPSWPQLNYTIVLCRYPLIIDPSGQATEFIMNEYKDRKITRTSFLDDAFRKNLESALRFGNPLLVQVCRAALLWHHWISLYSELIYKRIFIFLLLRM